MLIIDQHTHTDINANNHMAEYQYKLPISMELIVMTDIPNLNRIIKSLGLSKEEGLVIKEVRKRIKRRGYERKRKERINTVIESLEKQRDDLQSALSEYKGERDHLRQVLEDLYYKD